MSDIARDRDPQTDAMAVGSSFDAHVKHYLSVELGVDLIVSGEKVDFDGLLLSQVEPHNLKDAVKHGRDVFVRYKASGLLDALLRILKESSDIRFENKVEREIDGVPLLGKPDLYFRNAAGARVILDWKVNGYLSKSKTSPKAGYLHCWPTNNIHKNCYPSMVDGMLINTGSYFEADWGVQLATYGWLLGEPVGSEIIVGIDQFTGHDDHFRVSVHRGRVSRRFQEKLFQQYKNLWNIINSDHIFRDMPLEESQKMCQLLDSTNPNDEWLMSLDAKKW